MRNLLRALRDWVLSFFRPPPPVPNPYPDEGARMNYRLIKFTSRLRPDPPRHPEGGEMGVTASLITTAPAVKLPFVPDLSKWDPVTNWDALNPRPDLIISRATYGASYVDPYYAEVCRESRARGYPFWAYHFFLYTATWSVQADLFIRVCRENGLTPDFVPVLDIEGSLPTGMTQATANGMIENWLGRVETALGRVCYIYSSRNYLSKLYTTTAPAWLRDPRRLKWVAGYPSDPNAHDTMPAAYVPVGIDPAQVCLWQYTASAYVGGITSAVDCNQYQNGFRPVYPAPEPPPEPSDAEKLERLWAHHPEIH